MVSKNMPRIHESVIPLFAWAGSFLCAVVLPVYSLLEVACCGNNSTPCAELR